MAGDQGSGGNPHDMAPGSIRPTLESIQQSANALQAGRTRSPDENDALRIRDEFLRQDLAWQKGLTNQLEALTDQILKTQKLREKYAERVYTLLKWWVFVVVTLLIFDALDPPTALKEIPSVKRLLPSFDVETPIMLGILGSTTVAMIGLVLAVVKGLFSGSSKG